jgi:thioredoxin
MNTPKTVTELTFDTEVLAAPRPVLVDFWAAWCGPCRMVAPVVEEIARDYTDRLMVAKVDVDEAGTIAMRYGIMSIPTLSIFHKGQMIERIVGFMPKGELTRRIDRVLAGLKQETAGKA